MIVAVTGATGYVGRFVVANLQKRGAVVRAWMHSGTEPLGFTGPIRWIPGDLRSPDAMKALVHGANALVHTAFELLPGDGKGDDLESFLFTNLMGTLRLLSSARSANLERVVLLSSHVVYGAHVPKREIDEEIAPRPDTHYGAYMAAMEAFGASWSAQGLPCCSLRTTGVYGPTFPRERSKWFPLVSAILRGEAGIPSKGGAEVHGNDVARAVWLLLTEPSAVGQVYNCSDLYLTTRDIAQRVQRLSGVTGPLPEEPANPPAHIMDCRKLQELGWQPGGESLFEVTLGQLIDLARRRMNADPAPFS